MNNIITKTDSYKVTHWGMYPEGTEYVYSYFEARPGAKFDETVFFGLQYLLKKYLAGVVITQEKIEQAAVLFKAHFGNNKRFNREGWEHILHKHGGKLPVKIYAVPEGTPVTINNIMMAVVNTDPHNTRWLTNYLESLLTHVWYGSTVATLSREVKKVYKHYLDRTADNADGINFMLHDFGYRGVSSDESAGIGGAAHLINFLGTDTLPALEVALEYYKADLNNLGFSIPATEHSIMTAQGREGENKVVAQLLKEVPDGLIAIVGDSFDIYKFASDILGTEFKDQIITRDGVVVLRPDSGDPEVVVLKLLNILAKQFGFTTNRKGFRVLNPKIRLIWGDGIDLRGIENVLGNMSVNGWSAENIAFGMGGGLLQKINRDTQRFAFKSSAQYRNGKWHDVFKDPIDGSKSSKRGILKLQKVDDKFVTTRVDSLDRYSEDNLLNLVFDEGDLKREYTFDEVRKNAKI